MANSQKPATWMQRAIATTYGSSTRKPHSPGSKLLLWQLGSSSLYCFASPMSRVT